MTKCNNKLRYKATISGVDSIIEVNAIIDAGTISLDLGKYMITENDTLSCQVGYSELSKINGISVGFRFILNNTVWKVEGIDPVSSALNTEQGVIIIKLTSDLFVSQDNKVTGIAYNAPVVMVVTHSYVLSSTVVNASITVNTTQQMISSVSDNSVLGF